MSPPVSIRPEEPRDADDIRVVHQHAFGRPNEAALVDTLRGVPRAISLVATIDGRLVGHILFTPVEIHVGSDGGRTGVGPGSDPVAEIAMLPVVEIAMLAVGLAPMGVLPEYQRQGIGSDLARAGLNACRAEGHAVVVVLGHPAFYSRFGFGRASTHGIAYERPVPADAFMVLELKPGVLSQTRGVVRYRPEFRNA